MYSGAARPPVARPDPVLCIPTCDLVQFSQREADGVGSVRAACGINSHLLSVQTRRLHFSFIAHVSVLMEKKDEPERGRKRVHEKKRIGLKSVMLCCSVVCLELSYFSFHITNTFICLLFISPDQ